MVEARFRLGNVYVQAQRWGGGATSKIPLDSQPNHADLHNIIAVTHAMQNHLKEAIWHFKQAVRLKPDSTEARANLLRAQQALTGNAPNPERIPQ